MTLYALQHVPFEGTAAVGRWAERNGIPVEPVPVYQGGVLPDPADCSRIVVLGGPMNIHEEQNYPWLVEEKRFLRAAVDGGARVLGICLGGQLLADVLGATVVPGPHKEIGWHPVRFSEQARALPLFEGFPEELEVMHWHGDTFSLPPDCIRLASSPGCPEQGYVHPDGRLVGVQFHMEWDRAAVQSLIDQCPEDLEAGPFVQSPETMLREDAPFEAANAWMDRLLDRLFL